MCHGPHRASESARACQACSEALPMAKLVFAAIAATTLCGLLFITVISNIKRGKIVLENVDVVSSKDVANPTPQAQYYSAKGLAYHVDNSKSYIKNGQGVAFSSGSGMFSTDPRFRSKEAKTKNMFHSAEGLGYSNDAVHEQSAKDVKFSSGSGMYSTDNRFRKPKHAPAQQVRCLSLLSLYILDKMIQCCCSSSMHQKRPLQTLHR